MATTTWRKLITEAITAREDTFIAWTLTDDDADRAFDSGYGGSEGEPFTAWGKRYVYFPVVYDGAEWVGSAPRDPCDEKTDHVGGQ